MSKNKVKKRHVILPFRDNLADVDDSGREWSFVLTSGSISGSISGSGISYETSALPGVRVVAAGQHLSYPEDVTDLEV